MAFDNQDNNNDILLSEEMQQEILERDRLYEAGEMPAFSLEEVLAYFNIKKD